MAAENPYANINNQGVMNTGPGTVNVSGAVGPGSSVRNIHHHRRDTTTPEPEPEFDGRAPMYTPKTKATVCRRLHTSWLDLADELGLGPNERHTFPRGREAFELWEWLEVRDRLGELRGALAAIGRGDLVAVLDRDTA